MRSTLVDFPRPSGTAMTADETFFEFSRRHEIAELRDLAERTPLTALVA